MSFGLANKKKMFNRILDILQKADSIVIELDAALVKPPYFERASLLLGGMTAVLPVLLHGMELEINEEESDLRMQKELDRLIEEERARFKRAPQIPPTTEDDPELGQGDI